MPTILDILISYLPSLVLRRFFDEEHENNAPFAERLNGAVLFADISGFTHLTEKLAQRGTVGAEELSGILNDYFSKLIELITYYGGEVIKFAGDALLAFWQAEGEDLSIATIQATTCALKLQDNLQNYHIADDTVLRVKISIGVGEIFNVHLGGVYQKGEHSFERWELVVTGDPLNQVSLANHYAQPGQVILASPAYELIKNQVKGQTIEAVCFKALSLNSPVIELSPKLFPDWVVDKSDIVKRLQAYLPGAILARLEAGQAGWLAELRRVTVVFINLPELNHTTPLAKAQTITQALQNVIYDFEGSINKLNVDDKGVSLLAAFGLPPLSHENDAVRAVQAAQFIQMRLQELGMPCAIGITSGRAFCGAIGNTVRREYTMIGDVVNLAARLMQAAPGTILCDMATYQASKSRHNFEILSPIMVKGKTEPVPVFHPTSAKGKLINPTIQGSILEVKPPDSLIGRELEQQILSENLLALQGGESRVIIIEGEAGIGKSHLVAYLRDTTNHLAITTLIGAGDAIEQTKAYFAWQAVLSELLGVAEVAEPESRRAQVLAQLEPEWVRFAPLLNDVVPLGLRDSELTAQMSGQVRADNLRELIIYLLQRQIMSKKLPLLIILEDVHWLDSASWATTMAVARQVKPLMLILATRPLSDPLPLEYSQLLTQATLLKLEPLAEGDVLRLVCQRLGIKSLPEAVVQFIHLKAEGHPFYSEELAYALRDANLITIDKGVCYLTTGTDNLQTLDFPDTLQGVITSRLDRLPPSQQLTLKVASVIGRVFAFKTLLDIHPIESDKPLLQHYLATLERLNLTPLNNPEPDLAYLFNHIITQEVAYNLMLFSQRRELHQAVAQWYEQNYSSDLSPYYAFLAYHWGKAKISDKTIEYLEKAGEQAIKNYADKEAIGFFSELITLNERTNIITDKFRWAEWERQLGEAYLNLGQTSKSQVHLERALPILDRPLAQHRVKLAINLLVEVLQQLKRHLLPLSLVVSLSEAEKDQLWRAVYLYDRLARAYYFSEDSFLTTYTMTRACNLAERGGASRELAVCYGYMTYVAGLIPLHFLAKSYAKRYEQVKLHIPPTAKLAAGQIALAFYYTGAGNFAEALTILNEVIAVCEQLGSWREWEEAMSILIFVKTAQGEFLTATKLAKAAGNLANKREDFPFQLPSLAQEGHVLLIMEQLGPNSPLLEEGAALIQNRSKQIGDGLFKSCYYAVLGLAQLRAGQINEALQMADQIRKVVTSSRPLNPLALHFYNDMLEIYLGAFEIRLEEQVKLMARQACAALYKFSKLFPVGCPDALIYQGWYLYLVGKTKKAFKLWHKGLIMARKLQMPYEEGRAYYEIGRHLAKHDHHRQEHLLCAIEIFKRIGANYDLKLAQAAITD